jgi:hypothetical protein
MKVSRLVLFDQAQRANESVRAKGIESPLTRSLGQLSYRHWFLGSLAQVGFIYVFLLLLILIFVLGRDLDGTIIGESAFFVVVLGWFALFNRWRGKNGRS